jgi:hypothetical protein
MIQRPFEDRFSVALVRAEYFLREARLAYMQGKDVKAVGAQIRNSRRYIASAEKLSKKELTKKVTLELT